MTVRCASRSRSYVACVLLICGTTLVSAQATPQGTAASTLSVAGDVRTPLSITPAELKAMLRTSVDVKDEVTRNAADVGKFKAPTLRNVAVTAPYMHDGSVATLEDAIDHYAAGGRTIATGDYAGIGRDNPNKSSSVQGFALTKDQRADLIAFLGSLTDEALLRDPRFGNPWVRQPDR